MNKQSLQQIFTQTSPSEFLDYKAYLLAVFNCVKNEVGKYRYSDFGRDLGLTDTNVVNHILKGRRPLTNKASQKVAKNLGLKNKERRYFLAMVEYVNAKNQDERDRLFQKLYVIRREALPRKFQTQQLEYYSSWLNPLLGELARCRSINDDVDIINKCFWKKTSKKEIKSSLELLVDIGVLEKDTDGNYHRTDLDFSTGNATKKLAISSYHRQMLQLSEEALAKVPKGDRNISAITLVLSKENKKELSQLISEFQRKILELEAKEQQREDITQVNLQMFTALNPQGKAGAK